MSERLDPIAEPMPDDPAALRSWAIAAAQAALSLRDRVIGAESATRVAIEAREAAETERDELRERVRALESQLTDIFESRLWRLGRRMRAPLRALRLWR